MKLFLPPLFIAILLSACTTAAPPRPNAVVEIPYGPSQQEIDEAKRYAQEGMPFTVEIDPYGAIFDHSLQDGELPHLKQNFLVPLAKSRYAARIQRVRIDAGAGEWLYWTCVVELKDGAFISIKKPAGFYHADSRHPDAYSKAREYVLSTIDQMGRRLTRSH